MTTFTFDTHTEVTGFRTVDNHLNAVANLPKQADIKAAAEMKKTFFATPLGGVVALVAPFLPVLLFL